MGFVYIAGRFGGIDFSLSYRAIIVVLAMSRSDQDHDNRLSRAMDFDTILSLHVGEFGKYQKCMFALLFCVSITVAFNSFIHAFTGINPDLTSSCHVGNHDSMEYNSSSYEHGLEHSSNITATTRASVDTDNDLSRGAERECNCEEYQVDATKHKSTIVIEVC